MPSNLYNIRYFSTAETAEDMVGQIIDAETFHAAQVEHKKRAKSLRRDHFVSESTVLEVPSEFSISPVLQHFDDPQKQAEYIYSLIESEF